MPRVSNKDLGTCPCYGRDCPDIVPVRRQGAKGPLYLFCNNKETCGGTKHFNQAYIMANATMDGKPALNADQGKPVKVEKVPPVEETPLEKPKPKAVRRKAKKKTERLAKPAGVNEGAGSWFDTLLG